MAGVDRMVQRAYVKCPICDKLYQLKVQLDKNISIFEWPISFECKDCGEVLEYKYSNKGLQPKEFEYKPVPEETPVTTLGYSSSLPITDEVYLKDLTYDQSLALFSNYMNLNRGYFAMEETSGFDYFLRRMQANLLPYRECLWSLLPFLKKGNAWAFSKKLAIIFDEKRYTPLDSTQKMYDAYFELIEKSHRNLMPGFYEQNCYEAFVTPLNEYLSKVSGDEIRAIKEKLDKSGKISLWYKEEAVPCVARMLRDIQKLIPAMIYTSAGVSDVRQRGDLKIVTISCDDATDIYRDGYEVLCHGLKVFVGLNNLLTNGDMDAFTNPKFGNVSTLAQFASLNGGKMLEHLENDATVSCYLDGVMNNKIRNAASHSGGIEYDVMTQEVICHYDAKDDAKVYCTSLIEICHLSYLMLLHIMEITLMARTIVEKAK